jgi:hypothetical protein
MSLGDCVKFGSAARGAASFPPAEQPSDEVCAVPTGES